MRQRGARRRGGAGGGGVERRRRGGRARRKASTSFHSAKVARPGVRPARRARPSASAVRRPRWRSGNACAGVARQPADDGHVRAAGALQEVEVTARADAVGEEAGERRAPDRTRAGRRRSPRSCAPCRRRRRREHRRREPLGDLGGRALVAVGRRAVEQAHHAFDERDVGAARRRARRSPAPPARPIIQPSRLWLAPPVARA